jgi:hypothetical protein
MHKNSRSKNSHARDQYALTIQRHAAFFRTIRRREKSDATTTTPQKMNLTPNLKAGA